MASPLWWKFSLPGLGAHLLRAKNVGMQGQEVLLDGIPLDAPEGTLTFTGPGACLLELQNVDGVWTLLVDGTAAEPHAPEAAAGEAPAVAWFKFSLPGAAGTHHVRVANIGSEGQQILLDGSPLEAPAGTMEFTGPKGTLLQLQKRDGFWVLMVDGTLVHRCNPHAGSQGSSFLWNFEVPGAGPHYLLVTDAGTAGQQVFLDSQLVPGPPGQTDFTGPGGTLLQLQRQGESYLLLVDGEPIEPTSGEDAAAAAESEASWCFVGPSTGAEHRMHVSNIGRKGQQVFIDGALVPGPDMQTAFTGPGGALLELKQRFSGWTLFVDGNAVGGSFAAPGPPRHSVSTAPTGWPPPASAAARGPLAADALPQGVSYDSSSGKYSANIRVQSRFKCLGEFPTPEEAHARYLEAKKELGS